MEKGSIVDALIQLFAQHKIWDTEKSVAVKKAFQNQSSQNFCYFLLTEGLATRNQLLNVLSHYYQVPAFDVVGYFFDHELLRKFPKDVLLRNEMIPLEVDQNMLVVIASQPNNSNLLPILGNFVSYDIQFMVGLAADITDAVKEFYEEAVTVAEEDSDIKSEYREKEQAYYQEDSDEEF